MTPSPRRGTPGWGEAAVIAWILFGWGLYAWLNREPAATVLAHLLNALR